MTYGPVSFGPTNTDYTHALLLQRWNPASFAGEILTGVTINFTLSQDLGLVTLTNTATGPETFTLTATSSVTTSGPPDSLSPDPISVNLFTFGVMTLGPGGSGNCAFATPNAACSVVQFNPGAANGSSTVNAAPANFSFYTGAGTFGLTAVTLSSTSFDGGGNNIQLGVSETATITGTVIYNYADSGAPEPATMALLGSALVGLGLFGRKRFSR